MPYFSTRSAANKPVTACRLESGAGGGGGVAGVGQFEYVHKPKELNTPERRNDNVGLSLPDIQLRDPEYDLRNIP